MTNQALENQLIFDLLAEQFGKLSVSTSSNPSALAVELSFELTEAFDRSLTYDQIRDLTATNVVDGAYHGMSIDDDTLTIVYHADPDQPEIDILVESSSYTVYADVPVITLLDSTEFAVKDTVDGPQVMAIGLSLAGVPEDWSRIKAELRFPERVTGQLLLVSQFFLEPFQYPVYRLGRQRFRQVSSRFDRAEDASLTGDAQPFVETLVEIIGDR